MVSCRTEEAESSTGESRTVAGKDEHLEHRISEPVQDLSF